MLRKLTATLFGIALLATAGTAFAASGIAVNGPGLNGTNYKLDVSFSGSPVENAYVRTDEAVGETHYRMRFWLDPRNLPLTEGNAGTNHIRFFRVNDQNEGPDTALGSFIVGFITKSETDHAYHWINWVKGNDLVYHSRGNIYLGNSGTDLPAQLEVEFWQGNAPTQTFCMRKLAPFSLEICKSVDNLSDGDVDFVDFGSFTNSNPSLLTGDYYFDEFESYR